MTGGGDRGRVLASGWTLNGPLRSSWVCCPRAPRGLQAAPRCSAKLAWPCGSHEMPRLLTAVPTPCTQGGHFRTQNPGRSPPRRAPSGSSQRAGAGCTLGGEAGRAPCVALTRGVFTRADVVQLLRQGPCASLCLCECTSSTRRGAPCSDRGGLNRTCVCLQGLGLVLPEA